MKKNSKRLIVIVLALLIIAGFIYRTNAVGTGIGEGLESSQQDKEIKTKEKIIFQQFNGEIYGENVHVVQNNPNRVEIRLNENAKITIKYPDGRTVDYSGFSKERIDFGGDKVDPKIILNADGSIKEAYLKADAGGTYDFGNDRIKLNKGDILIIKDGKAEISFANSGKIKTPESIDSKKPGMEFVFKHSSGGYFELENGDKFSGANLKYQEGYWYFDDSSSKIKIDSFAAKNTDGATVYLDFKGESSKDYQGAYISINKNEKTIVIGTNTEEDSPSLMFNANNPYGISLEQTDHFAVKALGNSKYSYISITDKDRSSNDLVPLVKIVGNGAINNDDKGFGTYLKDNKFYMRINSRYITDFNDFKGNTPVPVEISAYKLDQQGKETPISLTKVVSNGKDNFFENKFLISNRLEVGFGPNPTWIPGASYQGDYPLLVRGISNRVFYNYVPYTKEGFEKYTKIALSMDEYSKSLMTPDKYRMLIDLANTLTPENKRGLRTIYIHRTATMGGWPAMAWGGPGFIEIGFRNLDPGTIRHEATHAIALASDAFQRDWLSVGGGRVAFTSDYGRSNEDEDAAEFGGEFIYKSPAYTARYLINDQYSKYYRGKMAVLLKHNIIDRSIFNLHFANAGLPTDDASIQRYINEARG